jgi:hypothetical protein
VPAFDRGAVAKPNTNTVNITSTSFFSMVEIPCVLSGGLNPATGEKLPKK